MNGIILLNKTEGITSFRAGNRVRGFLSRLTGTKHKVGHTGTLDPMATGVLPLLIDGASRFSQYLPEHGKAYRAAIKLGVTTDTLDRTGQQLLTRPVECGKSDVERVLQGFLGELEQVPPMFSAVSVGGVRLYELARRGESVERKSRRVTIHSIELVSADEEKNEYTIDVSCSAGTYIRSLAADLGEALGCGAHLSALCRTMANGFPLAACVTQEELEQAAELPLIPLSDVLDAYPALSVSAAQAVRFGNGGALERSRCAPVADGLVRILAPDGSFLGLARAEGGTLFAERVLARSCD
ncbi:MAG: tRNA pseudouridine(55) synthase TruB [Clostridium sp.]|jgi:tRNA pseudouridine55 synthase|nr:tRNA pseudouridine(55) synthase TruB [Clostridium sp.]